MQLLLLSDAYYENYQLGGYTTENQL